MGHLEFGKGFTKLPLEEYLSGCNDAPCWLDDSAPLTFHRKCNSTRCLCGVCSARDPLALPIGTSSWIKKEITIGFPSSCIYYLRKFGICDPHPTEIHAHQSENASTTTGRTEFRSHNRVMLAKLAPMFFSVEGCATIFLRLCCQFNTARHNVSCPNG